MIIVDCRNAHTTSDMGQFRPFDDVRGMSAFPYIATKLVGAANIGSGQQANNGDAAKGDLFDHLIGAVKQRGRHGDSERLGGLEVDDQ